MMKNFFPKILTTAALCLAAGTFLNSCMISNIGGTIRDMGEEKTAVDTNNPVGGVVYRKNSTYDSQVIMQAPEVVYSGRDGLIRDNKGGFCCFGCPEVKETGRTLWVQVDSTGAYTLLTAAPSHEWKKEEFSQIWRTPANRLRPYKTRETCNKTLLSAIAVPFDYAIDPALTVGYSTLWILSLPFVWVLF